ncbi:UbiA family prenyltransferase [Amycolatopsis sp. cg5]|uniref:UbiA family prenyltransferase n=1 Tax=Amycolatopsis sp. cg5 TaxID=3238802 RepID=UPI0035269370
MDLRIRFLAHLEACRPDTVFYSGLVGLAGAVLTNPDAGFPLLFSAWLTPTLAWIASLYGGDYFDRDLDAQAKPQRPIPSGRMRAETAKNLMIAYIGAGALIAVIVNPRTIALAVLAAAFGIAYARYLKGHGLWGNISRGLPTAAALLFGSMTVQPLPLPELVPLALMFWIHDSGSNLLGALCDRDGDRAGGYFTYPVRRGDEATVRALAWFYGLWVGILALWPLTVTVDPAVYWPGALTCAALGAVSLLSVSRAPRPIPRPVGLKAHEIVVAERIILASFITASTGQLALALLVACPSLALTVLARHLMRPRYEPARRP